MSLQTLASSGRGVSVPAVPAAKADPVLTNRPGRSRWVSRAASESLVVVPTYNERENIAKLILALQGLAEPVDILVVDDNSPDGTAEVVRRLMRQREGIYLLQRPGKQGLGTAYRAGFAFALRHVHLPDGCGFQS